MSTEEQSLHLFDNDNTMLQLSNNNNGLQNDKCQQEPDVDAVLNFLRKRGLDAAILEVQRHLEKDQEVEEEEVVENGKVLNKKQKTYKNDNDQVGSEEQQQTQNENDDDNNIVSGGDNDHGNEKDDSNNEGQSSLVASGQNDEHDKEEEERKSEMSFVCDEKERNENKSSDETMQTELNTIRIDKTIENVRAGGDHNSHDDGDNDDDDDVIHNGEDRIFHSIEIKSRQEEARRGLEAFYAFQTWALNLPDDHEDHNDNDDHDDHEEEDDSLTVHRKQDGQPQPQQPQPQQQNNTYATTCQQGIRENDKKNTNKCISFIPVSIKPEVLLVTFPLFCYTYCDLLENHLEHTAAVLLYTFQHIYEVQYPMEFRDLEQCCTTERILKLKKLVMEARVCLSKIKATRKSCEKRKDSNAQNSGTMDASLETEYKESVATYKTMSKRLKSNYPFLSRVMFMKWYLNISSTTYGYLARYLRSDDMLLPMSILLQSRCHVVVEKRRPLAFVPACVLEDMIYLDQYNDDDDDDADIFVDNHDWTDKEEKDGVETKSSVVKDIQWAAPMHPVARSNELGDGAVTVMKNGKGLPFPKFYLNEEYETVKGYERDKKCVEFNRALLTNGFRRLAALELKNEYESGLRHAEGETMGEYGNPLEPSVLLSTLCTSLDLNQIDDSKLHLEETGVEITCAKLSPLDGRFVAAGCSDSAVRIWSADSWKSLNANGSIDSSGGAVCTNPAVVLIGHKRSLPVFDLDWNRDGRTLISAGGDGSLRLWDTRAVGSVGETAQIGKKEHSRQNGAKDSVSISNRPGTHVPGAKAESTAHRHGSALVSYQGHSPMTPVWSVSIAPCGYYFASAGADSTARLWCTDRKTPVRIFAGHCSENINTVTWHPNCNYILTGSDDKTVRMWDVQSGKCVRLFNGCPEGVNQVKVSHSGLFIAGADYSGVVHLWDVRNGKKLNEFRWSRAIPSGTNHRAPIVRSICFSRCGAAIATGSDDGAIRIWDNRSTGNYYSNSERFAISDKNKSLNSMVHYYSEPNTILRTKRTSVLDLHYTKQNLLLSVGKYFQV
jgi:WD40 repeat protein